MIAVVFVVMFLSIDYLVTGYPSLDWYYFDSVGMTFSDYFINDTILNIAEMALMVYCLYLHRLFPKEFGLSVEIISNIAFCFVLNTIVNAAPVYFKGDMPCLLLFKFGAATDSIRALSFITILFFITMTKFSYFPLPFTWVFNDLSKFVFEPVCVNIFMKYLRKKEPEQVKTFERLMSIYNSDFNQNAFERTSGSSPHASHLPKRRHSTSEESRTHEYTDTHYAIGKSTALGHMNHSVNRQVFLGTLERLEGSYKRFMKTKSFIALNSKIKEFEEICMRESQ